MIETIITICALTMVAPYYDCSQEWNITIYDETVDRIPDSERAIGRAIYSHGIFGDTGDVYLVHNYKNLKGKHDHMLKGGGVLWHELLHLKCRCDWHEHWDTLDEIGDLRHSRVKIPPIPQDVLPFLVIEGK